MQIVIIYMEAKRLIQYYSPDLEKGEKKTFHFFVAKSYSNQLNKISVWVLKYLKYKNHKYNSFYTIIALTFLLYFWFHLKILAMLWDIKLKGH